MLQGGQSERYGGGANEVKIGRCKLLHVHGAEFKGLSCSELGIPCHVNAITALVLS